jgi:uncharacterized protein YaiI (UPF0178 family)
VRLFVDGDAFVNLLKPILFRAIVRRGLETYVISNKAITIGEDTQLITYILVDAGMDVADDRIVEMVEIGDLVITADIPLADRVAAQGAYAIDHRGELYTEDSVKHHLAMRNLMEEIRSTGEITKGPAPFGKKDVEAFANQLNSFLTKHLR